MFLHPLHPFSSTREGRNPLPALILFFFQGRHLMAQLLDTRVQCLTLVEQNLVSVAILSVCFLSISVCFLNLIRCSDAAITPSFAPSTTAFCAAPSIISLVTSSLPPLFNTEVDLQLFLECHVHVRNTIGAANDAHVIHESKQLLCQQQAITDCTQGPVSADNAGIGASPCSPPTPRNIS